MADKTEDLELQQGKTQPLVLRCEAAPIVYKAITAISLSYGAPRLTVTGHGLPNGWRLWVTRVQGMKQINSENTDPDAGAHYVGTVIDADTLELNEVVPVDDNDREWPTYTGGGFIQYLTPMDLTSYAARMDIRDKKNGNTVLFSMTSANNLIDIDTTLKTVTLFFDAIDFTSLVWKKGYYELELFKTVTRNGQSVVQVYSPLEGNIFLDVETTK